MTLSHDYHMILSHDYHMTLFAEQGQTIDSHDYVFWCGDFNYRIDLPTSLAKDHIANRRWDKIYKHDQLSKQKKLNKVSYFAVTS